MEGQSYGPGISDMKFKNVHESNYYDFKKLQHLYSRNHVFEIGVLTKTSSFNYLMKYARFKQLIKSFFCVYFFLTPESLVVEEDKEIHSGLNKINIGD